MTSKIEARRFSGKPGTWSHYAMAVKAHIAIDELTDYFNDGTTVADNRKAAWKKAQLKIFQLFILTCDDRAATVLESVDDSQDGAGWAAYVALRDKFGDAKRAQLSKQIKKFFKRKQAPGESAADYLSDMKAKLAAIDKYPAEKIWEIMKSTTVVQNLRDDPDTEITKKLVSNRMAEAETDGKTLPYEQIESIIENDQAEADEKTTKPRKDDTPDLAMWFKGGGRGGRSQGQVGQWGPWRWRMAARPFGNAMAAAMAAAAALVAAVLILVAAEGQEG